MGKRLIIDLEKCDDCHRCDTLCAYFYRAHSTDTGILSLRERATFHLICRRCEEASCVDACTYGALERQEDGVLKRFTLRCVSCKLCAQACPFGTIQNPLLAFYETPCDHCMGRRDDVPPCVESCSKGAIEFREVSPGETGIQVIDVHFAARAVKWIKQEEPA